MAALLAPWRRPGRLARALGHVMLGFPLGLIAFIMMVVLIPLSAGLIVLFPIGFVLMAITLWLAHQFANIERHRAAAVLGRTIADPVAAANAPKWFGRLTQRLRSGPRWREAGYATTLFFPAVLGYVLTAAAWGGALAMVALPGFIYAFPDRLAHFWFFSLNPASAWLAVPIGLFGLAVAAPWVTLAMAKLQTGLAVKMLGPTREEELAAQVSSAEATRSAAVDAAEAERRRIERDLHDGAQQRLVALAADLGAARERMDHDPDGSRELVARAHEEAKGALREIRDLVRGIHPVILEDRGLDAALSAVVARSTVPVELSVDVGGRLPATIESAAYFVVSEALTNVSRHAQATKAHVGIARSGERLVIEVRDNGIGGADASTGTGLQGLRDRVAGLHGTMYVISPPGGPTTLSVELPCAS